ncbi:zinc-binding dehydrogenase [Microlunatus soli]|uniref:S-(Hydroxymethyl)glutathione dehydrogenase / alcohol dehydrogenase n=1 Tax=Microlunatus soli TaxID=630515 RepID=A0A1H1ZTE6_9ACTN|nr:zinc-binding dehydrogenase [Microlunatus soli]SDT37065.1 S-(hydroxymethyl)glutathione dehydrogenase / alcohol dehydrogenase [Microlunatus soli]
MVDTMRAAVWHGTGPELRIEEIPVPEPKTGEALVKLTSCGVCHSDLHVLRGEVAFPSPAVLGHEISGVVTALGPGTDDAAPAVGTSVVGAFIMPCGSCRQCERGRDDMCLSFFAQNRLNGTLYDGSSRLQATDGSSIAMYSMAGLAEYAVVPVIALAPLPPELPQAPAAILGCAIFTAYGAIRHSADLQPGETVAVVAIGGVGQSIVQLAKAMGAGRVIAIDVSDEKLAQARRLGADEVINSAGTDPVAAVRELTDGAGVDVAFEALGLPQTFQQASRMLIDGGRMVAIGIAAGDATAQIEITPLVRRGFHIMGSFGGRTRVDLPAVIDLAAQGKINIADAVSRSYRLDQVNDAYAALGRGEIRGRAVITME